MLRWQYLLPVAAAVFLAGCNEPTPSGTNTAPPIAQPPPAPSNGGPVTMADGRVDLGGLTAKTPEDWKLETPDNPVRRAQYAIPPASGDKQGAQLIVFTFGGEAGGVEGNLKRWASWFQTPDGKPVPVPTPKEAEVNGMKVHRAELAGTYVAAKSPMMPTGPHFNEPNYRMVGLIVETPNGSFFFRFIGPDKTIKANMGKLDQYINDLKPASGGPA